MFWLLLLYGKNKMKTKTKEIIKGIGLESISVIVGASFAGMGRAIGGDYEKNDI